MVIRGVLLRIAPPSTFSVKLLGIKNKRARVKWVRLIPPVCDVIDARQPVFTRVVN